MASSAPVFYFLVNLLGPDAAMAVSGDNKAPITVKETDEDFDLFGEESPEDKAAQEAVAAKVAAAKAEKKPKKEVINKSTLVFEIKPNSIDTDLDAVEKEVRQITLDGVEWSAASKKVPIAFGLNKLQMGCVIVDDLVATDDIQLKIELIGMTPEEAAAYEKKRDAGDDDEDDEAEAPGWVQSAEIVSFQKL